MKYKKSKILIIGTIILAFLCIPIPKAMYNTIETPNISSTYVPEGIIAMWSGTLDSIPAGWILCDGTQFTPNMTDRFVVNTNGTEDTGTIGGVTNHTHSYTDVPFHDHGSTGVATCSHSHTYNHPSGTFNARYDGVTMPALLTSTQASGAASGSHTHSTTVTGVGVGYTSEIEDLYPPYYKLAFIKKISEAPTIPVGIILVWSGIVGNIPEGWAVCNGTQSTPDLEGRFILGETIDDPGSYGGNSTHNHTYTEIPSHSHSTASSGAGHTHTAYCKTTLLAAGATSCGYPTPDQYTDYADVPHSHSMSGIGQALCTTEEANHEPPYTTVAFIMNTQLTDGIPTGCISLWDDTVANIPIGWGQCDGTSGTVDIREHFLKGSSLSEPIGTTGGSITHTHVYTEVPYHTHSIQTNNMHHRHQMYENNAQHGVSVLFADQNVFGPTTVSSSTGSSSASHSHDILPAGLASPETDSESNFPPFIELTYIQQLSSLTTIGWVSPEEDAEILFSRAATVQFDFEYSWSGLGNDITLSFTNGTDIHDAGSVLGLDNIFMPYLEGDVTATLHLYQDASELTTATRSFTFYNNRVPTVTLVQPNGGEKISKTFDVTWTGSDPDGDQLYYTLEYNIQDTGWVEIVSDLTGTSYEWDTTNVPDSNSVELRIIAQDAFGGQSIDESDAVFEINNDQIPGFNLWILISLLVIFSVLIAWKRKK